MFFSKYLIFSLAGFLLLRLFKADYIWLGYVELTSDKFTYLILGLPVSVAEAHSTTYDNDPIWLTVRFGLLGLGVFLYFWIRHLSCSRYVLISSVILLASCFTGVLVSFQLCLFTLCFLNSLERNWSRESTKIGIN